MISAGDGVGRVGDKAKSVGTDPQRQLLQLANDGGAMIVDSVNVTQAVAGQSQTWGRLTRQSLNTLWQSIFYDSTYYGAYGILPGIVEKPEEYADFREIKSTGGAEIYFKVVNEEKEKRVLLAGRVDDLASFLNIFIGDSFRYSQAHLAELLKSRSRGRNIYSINPPQARITLGYNQATEVYEAIIEPPSKVSPTMLWRLDEDFSGLIENLIVRLNVEEETGDTEQAYEVFLKRPDENFSRRFQDLALRFNDVKKVFERKELYEIEVSLFNNRGLEQVIGELKDILGRVGMPRSNRFWSLLNDSLVYRYELYKDIFASTGLHVAGADVGIRVDRMGNPQAFVFRIRERVVGLAGSTVKEQLWVGVPTKNGGDIFWEVHSDSPIDRLIKKEVIDLLRSYVFIPDINHFLVDEGKAFAARDLAEAGPGGRTRAKRPSLTTFDITKVVDGPMNLGNVSRILEGVLKKNDAGEILKMLKISTPDNVDLDDIAAWNRAINERPSGMSSIRYVNDGIEKISPVYVREIEVGVRKRDGAPPSAVFVVHQDNVQDYRTTFVVSPSTEEELLLEIEEESPEITQNADLASEVSERVRGFILALFKDGLTFLNDGITKLGNDGSSEKDENETPVGGNGGETSAGVVRDKIGSAHDAVSNEGTGGSAEHNAGYGMGDAFDISSGVFVDGVLDPMPVY